MSQSFPTTIRKFYKLLRICVGKHKSLRVRGRKLSFAVLTKKSQVGTLFFVNEGNCISRKLQLINFSHVYLLVIRDISLSKPFDNKNSVASDNRYLGNLQIYSEMGLEEHYLFSKAKLHEIVE